MTSRSGELLKAWVAEPGHTARSVLSTIFGDTILPVAHGVWLAQLFRLTDVFGYSQRLVRTSLFRLAGEGWFTTEKVGRESRYILTPLAIEESERAAERIYHSTHADWTGEWTVAFLDAPSLTANDGVQLTKHLHWHGFISLGRGMLASPDTSIDSARELCRLVVPDVHVPLAVLAFADLDTVVSDGFFFSALSIEDMTKGYDEFTRFYQRADSELATFTPQEAFALRTILIDDLRRIRLRGPDVPVALLPTDWAGTSAYALASDMYARLSEAASPWLSEVLETRYPKHLPSRFF